MYKLEGHKMGNKRRTDFRLDQDTIDKIDHIARAFKLTRTGALEYLVNKGYEAEREEQGLWQKALEKKARMW